MTSTNFDYIETTTWENGKRNGPYEAVYQENTRANIQEGTLKEQGQYKNGNKVGVWKYYDTKGNLTREKTWMIKILYSQLLNFLITYLLDYLTSNEQSE